MKIGIYLIVAIAIILETGCVHKDAKQNIPPPHIVITQAIMDTIPTRMEFVGQTYSNYDVTIQPRISGYLLSIHYHKGMPVDKGQLLFKIDPSLLRTRVSQTQASLSSADAQLIEARNNYNRAIPLAKINAISQSLLDQYRAQYLSAEATRTAAESDLKNARLELSYATIFSPINGIIGETNLAGGEYVGIGTQFAVLNTISNVDSIRVRLSLPMAEYLELRDKSQSNDPTYSNSTLLSNTELTLADGNLYPYKGSYAYTEKDAGASMGTIILVVKFPNPDRILKVGQYAKVTTDVGPSSGHVIIPQRCVNQSQGVNSIWVMKPDSTVEFRKIELGDTYGQMWIIESGLLPDETVLTSGQMKLHQGQKIVPLSATEAAKSTNKPNRADTK